MSCRVLTHCGPNVCVINFIGTLKEPSIYISVWHAGYPDICDSCDLRAWCTEFFGERGALCTVHKEGRRWAEIKPPERETLKTLFQG